MSYEGMVKRLSQISNPLL